MRATSPDATPLQVGALVGLTLTAYLPCVAGGFIFDDLTYLAVDPLASGGEELRRIWLTASFADYYPLTRTSFWLERRLWGASSLGYHAVNLALHVLNALLVWRLLDRLRVPSAWVAALLFALHPVNVQSVAWIAQRKTLLAAAFFFAALLAWLRFDARERRWGWYGVCCGAFSLALLSKISVVILPLLLPLLAWWRRGRIAARDLWPALPLLALAGGFALNGLWLELRNPVASGSAAAGAPLAERLANAGQVVGFYLGKAIWPERLSFVYARWPIDVRSPAAWAPGAALLAALAGLWACRRTAWGRAGLAALGWFSVCLIPVLGFADFGHLRYARVADQYQYLPLVAFAALLGGGGPALARRGDVAPRVIAATALALLVGVYATLTWRQASLYRDRGTIWRDTLAKDPGSLVAHNNLGTWYYQRGEHERASEHFLAALAIEPNPNSAANLGLVHLATGRPDEAAERFREVLRMDPEHAGGHYGLGQARLAQGRLEAAARHHRDALARRPAYAEAHAGLAAVLALSGRLPEAVAHYARAVELRPDEPGAREALALALRRLGRDAEALELERAARSR